MLRKYYAYFHVHVCQACTTDLTTLNTCNISVLILFVRNSYLSIRLPAQVLEYADIHVGLQIFHLQIDSDQTMAVLHL